MYTFNACWRDSNFWWCYGSKRMLWFLVTGKVLIFHCLISVSPPPSLSLSLFIPSPPFFPSPLFIPSSLPLLPPSLSLFPPPSLSFSLPFFPPSACPHLGDGGKVPLQWGLLEAPLLAVGLVATSTASHGVARAMVLGEVRTHNWIIALVVEGKIIIFWLSSKN